MRISLKTDWETKISEKTKVYLLKIKNRDLIDKTFDKFHEVDKMK